MFGSRIETNLIQRGMMYVDISGYPDQTVFIHQLFLCGCEREIYQLTGWCRKKEDFVRSIGFFWEHFEGGKVPKIASS